MKQVLILVMMTAFAGAATAQMRTIPREAKRGEISHVWGMVVEIDGKGQYLSAGAQIRDPDNRLVLPAYLPVKSDAKYVLDGSGMVHRVWILTAQEKAQADQEKPPEKKPVTPPSEKPETLPAPEKPVAPEKPATLPTVE